MKESKKEIDRLRKALSLGFIFVDRPTPGNEAAFRKAIANALLPAGVYRRGLRYVKPIVPPKRRRPK